MQHFCQRWHRLKQSDDLAQAYLVYFQTSSGSLEPLKEKKDALNSYRSIQALHIKLFDLTSTSSASPKYIAEMRTFKVITSIHNLVDPTTSNPNLWGTLTIIIRRWDITENCWAEQSGELACNNLITLIHVSTFLQPTVFDSTENRFINTHIYFPNTWFFFIISIKWVTTCAKASGWSWMVKLVMLLEHLYSAFHLYILLKSYAYLGERASQFD